LIGIGIGTSGRVKYSVVIGTEDDVSAGVSGGGSLGVVVVVVVVGVAVAVGCVVFTGGGG
jgi:hypothetical protein